jgi:hypothetical protein
MSSDDSDKFSKWAISYYLKKNRTVRPYELFVAWWWHSASGHPPKGYWEHGLDQGNRNYFLNLADLVNDRVLAGS